MSSIHVGVDVGGTQIKICCSENPSDVSSICVKTVDYPHGASCSELADCIFGYLARIADISMIRSLGIAVPGRIDVKSGTIMFAHNLNLYDAPLIVELNKRIFANNIMLMNDADAACYAEYCFGALHGAKNCCLITLGTGVGIGVIIDGKLFFGGMGRGTEFGHVCLDKSSDIRCTCGNYGCVEALCSASFVKNRGLEVFGEAQITAKTVFDRAIEGDERAVSIFDEYVDNLSAAVASIVAAYDPQIIAIGGGLSRAGEFLLAPLRKKALDMAFFETTGEITAAKLTGDAGAIGAMVASMVDTNV